MNDTYTIERKNDERIDELEVALLQYEGDCDLVHTFTPGLYSREMIALKGQIIVSKVHKTEHQFCMLRGAAMVLVNDEEWCLIAAPYVGITYPGTRRVFYILEDCSWITFHATDKTTVEEIEEEIIEPHVNSVLKCELKDLKNYLETN